MPTNTEETESTKKSVLEEAKDLLDFVDDDVDTKTEETKAICRSSWLVKHLTQY